MTEEQQAKLRAWAERQPALIGQVLAWWKEAHAADDADLADHLLMDEDRLLWLALCFMWTPDRPASDWQGYVYGIWRYTGAHADRLPRMLREYWDAHPAARTA